ncbi:adenosine 5'-monophosphoramidase [Schizosaccharomyces japonicus yFS275]|uniref:Adenosine 5'-monophosphoramidase n=1 Tax=Schizosaccharomyces japonicus (strain yFS275 / FY16936) TaxID=402676 RepID=B6K043_SCHJY|nr:adenosine 5'-monophosphoramidase [Schizosaccharomyces japonicus yFS275]EEB06193.1 adenosine 5'-monophosphoramidase [Schizosaccharomyces japonicus yFS275]
MSCIFCRIIKGEIPCIKIAETAKSLAFMDIAPTSKGHALVIPKEHGERLTDLSDESCADLLPLAKRVAKATGAENFNILQNNGRLAHQEVGHVHVHVIPKPNTEFGLVVGWPSFSISKEELSELGEQIRSRME